MIKNIVIAALVSVIATLGFSKTAEAHPETVWVSHDKYVVTKKIVNSGTTCIILAAIEGSSTSPYYVPKSISCNWNK